MKKFLLLCLLVAFSCVAAPAAKKEKKQKKEKAEYVWDWDGVRSGNATFDEYLMTVTQIWNDIEQYEAEFGQYHYMTDTICIYGKFYLLAYMQDNVGNLVTRSQVNWQVTNSIFAATNIVLEATNASLMTASATLELPSLGLNALVFGKYIKGGPMVIAKGMKEIGAIAKANKANARAWKAMKQAAIDPATLSYFSAEAIENMNRCCYLKEIVDTDPEYAAIVEVQSAKTPEELQAEADRISNAFAEATILPEDANKSLDNLDDLSGLDDLDE